MKIVLLGPPGGGKGTQAQKIIEKHGVPQISTGDILRKAIKDQTDLGKSAKAFMDRGELAPDELVISIINERISEPDCSNGFILDGFPRTLHQAEALNESLKEMGIGEIDYVIDLRVDAAKLVNRLTGRRVCKECSNMYHVEFNPSKMGDRCDKCGGELYQRADDTENTILKRFDVYSEQARALESYYSESGRYKLIDADAGIEEVSAEVLRFLDGDGN